MGTLKVANVHFSNTSTIRVEHVGADNVLRIHANAMLLPIGTTSNRPTGTPGLIRYNADLGQFEGYNSYTWGAISAGSGGDAIAAFLKGNVAHETANGAFFKGNTAHAEANTVWTYAANDVMRVANSAALSANTAQIKGNAAHNTANTAVTNAATAQAKGAAAHETANTIGTGTYAFTGNKTHAGTQVFNGASTFNAQSTFANRTDFNVPSYHNAHAVVGYAIASPSNYWDGLQLEVSNPSGSGGTVGIGLHRNGISHVGIYHDATNVLKFAMSSGTPVLNWNTGTIWGSGNHGAGSGLHADLLDGYHASAFALTTGAVFTGETYCDAGLHASVFRPRSDPWNWYVAPNGTSVCNDFRATIFYIRSDTNNYFAANDLRLRGGSPTITLRDWDNLGCALHTNSNLFYIIRTPVDNPNFESVNGQWPFVFNLSNNDATCGGTFYCVNNIVAYSSDARLKENLVKISTPLEKIQQLNGYVFDWKDKVKDLGFNPMLMKKDCGLIAQEVQKVIPQAVTEAGFDKKYDANTDSYISKSGENYLTVQYEKLVPLLVEAIKELSKEVKELKAKVG